MSLCETFSNYLVIIQDSRASKTHRRSRRKLLGMTFERLPVYSLGTVTCLFIIGTSHDIIIIFKCIP